MFTITLHNPLHELFHVEIHGKQNVYNLRAGKLLNQRTLINKLMVFKL